MQYFVSYFHFLPTFIVPVILFNVYLKWYLIPMFSLSSNLKILIRYLCSMTVILELSKASGFFQCLKTLHTVHFEM